MPALETLLEPATRGDPESPLRWTCKSTRQLAAELKRQKHRVSHTKVAKLLHEAGYSLQANRKTREGTAHPDRNAQFEYINQQTKAFQKRRQTGDLGGYEKEGIGRGFQEWRPGMASSGKTAGGPRPRFPRPRPGQGDPLRRVRRDQQRRLGQRGHRSRHGRFAAEAIRRWWTKMGRRRFPKARQLCDHGGRRRQQRQSHAVVESGPAEAGRRDGADLVVCHFPPGTSKWNKIEHRLFCHITQNWRGKPLVSHDVSSNSSAARPPRRDSRSKRNSTATNIPRGKKSPTNNFTAFASSPPTSTATGTTPFNPTENSGRLIHYES